MKRKCDVKLTIYVIIQVKLGRKNRINLELALFTVMVYYGSDVWAVAAGWE